MVFVHETRFFLHNNEHSRVEPNFPNYLLKTYCVNKFKLDVSYLYFISYCNKHVALEKPGLVDEPARLVI